MTRLFLIMRVILIFIICLVLNSASAATNKGGEIDYDISVRIDPITRSVEGRSVITVTKPKALMLVLGSHFEVTKAVINGKELGTGRSHTGQKHIWRIPYDLSRLHRIEIHWQGELSQLDLSLNHQQTLGRVEPVSSENGTFLPNASGWFPRIADALARYRVTLELPLGQRGLVAGRLVEESESEQGYRASFEFPHPSEGIDLMAGPYEVETDTFHSGNGKAIQLRTYFHSQIKHLAHDYLDAVKGYLKLYEPWIGHYPFTEFSVVSSPTPTGFGMPTLTYLGINVLRLPFIRATSLGHEVLHNWWGNGVYPDYTQGNWSEGLTTFMADYAYKERASSEAARDMRLGWLRDFAALLPGQDEPLSTFTSRTHGASKIVGYNKAALFFFMLRNRLGKPIFHRAIQTLWSTRRFKITSWQHIQSIFEIVSGQDLKEFFSQWLNRSGAPSIKIVAAKQTKSETGYQMSLTLAQSAPIYQLSVPIVIRSAKGEETQVLDLAQDQQTFTFDMQNKPLEVVVDPDLYLFRQLAPGEAPPILREVMVNQTAATILLPEEGMLFNIAETLATRLQYRKLKIVPATHRLPAVPTLVIGLQKQVDNWLATNSLPIRPEIVTDTGSAQAWTLSRPDGITVAIVSAQDIASLEALMRPLPHYGRQSYIVFEGSKVIEKGAWAMQEQVVAVE